VRVFLLLLSSLLISTSLNAAEKGPSEDQRVGEGLVLMLKGENQKAWDLLFPEAKAGNVTAMYHLGMMMMRATNTPDHLQRAKTFFEAAAKRGHASRFATLRSAYRGNADRHGLCEPPRLPTCGSGFQSRQRTGPRRCRAYSCS